MIAALFSILNNKCMIRMKTTSILSFVRNHYRTAPAVLNIRWNAAVTEAAEWLHYPVTENTSLKVITQDHAVKTLLDSTECRLPFIKKSRDLQNDGRLCLQIRGLVTLLVGSAVGHTPQSKCFEDAMQKKCRIAASQRHLADAIEFFSEHIKAHGSVTTNRVKETDLAKQKEKRFQNTMKLLFGDYFLANGYNSLSRIRNHKVFALIVSALNDFCHSSFSCKEDDNGYMIPDDQSPLSTWEELAYLTEASLLSKGCQGMVLLGGHDEYLQNKASSFGKYFSLALKANEDIRRFCQTSEKTPQEEISTSLLPIIMHLESDKELLKQLQDGENVSSRLDHKRLCAAVEKGDSLEKAHSLMAFYVKEAVTIVDTMGSSLAVRILKEMTDSLLTE